MKRKVTDIIVGDFFTFRAPARVNTFESLNRDDIKGYKEMFQYPERFSLGGDETISSKTRQKREVQGKRYTFLANIETK